MVIPSPISSMARSTIVLITTATAPIVTVSAQNKNGTVSNPGLMNMIDSSERLTQRIPSKQPPLPPNTHLHLPEQNPAMLPSENVKIHSGAILAQFLTTADFPASDDAAGLVFLQPSLIGEEACKVLADLGRFRRKAGDGAGGLESSWEDCAEETRRGHCGFFEGLRFLAAWREGEALEGFFVHLVMGDEGGLRRLERRRHFWNFGWMMCSMFGLVAFGDVLGIR
jgi:hypothetical protein